MNCATNAWSSMLTKEAEAVWDQERLELKNVSMLLFILDQQFEIIKKGLRDKISTQRQQLDSLDKKSPVTNNNNKSILKLLKSNNTKENSAAIVKENREPLINKSLTNKPLIKQHSKESPDIFNVSPHYVESSEEESTEKRSPKINRNSKYLKRARQKDVNKVLPKKLWQISKMDKSEASTSSSKSEESKADDTFKIESTPKPQKKKLKSNKIMQNNTLTQMFVEKESAKKKIEADKSVNISELIDLMICDTPNEDASTTQVDPNCLGKSVPSCKVCDELGMPCRTHMPEVELREPDVTFEGFWDMEIRKKQHPVNTLLSNNSTVFF